MSSFTRAGIAVLVVLALHALATGLHWYEYWSWFDIPMHFSGGVAIAFLALAGWETLVQKINFQPQVSPCWQAIVSGLIILGIVALVGIAWEWYEFIFDLIAAAAYPNMSPAQTSLGDTMADLALDLAGGTLALVLARVMTRGRKV